MRAANYAGKALQGKACAAAHVTGGDDSLRGLRATDEEIYMDHIMITDDRNALQFERVYELLGETYWAKDRTREEFERACDHSICYSLLVDGVQAGFARVVTDYVSVFYLGDVIIAPEYRGKGLGVKLVAHVMGDSRFNSTLGVLLTGDAQGLYEKFGFVREGERFMSVNRIETD